MPRRTQEIKLTFYPYHTDDDDDVRRLLDLASTLYNYVSSEMSDKTAQAKNRRSKCSTTSAPVATDKRLFCHHVSLLSSLLLSDLKTQHPTSNETNKS